MSYLCFLLQALIDQLQGKIRSYKKQIEEAEEIAALNLAKFRQTQANMADTSERADIQEQVWRHQYPGRPRITWQTPARGLTYRNRYSSHQYPGLPRLTWQTPAWGQTTRNMSSIVTKESNPKIHILCYNLSLTMPWWCYHADRICSYIQPTVYIN